VSVIDPEDLQARLAAVIAAMKDVAHDGLAAARHLRGEIRFDVVSVLRPRKGPALVEHVRAAF